MNWIYLCSITFVHKRVLDYHIYRWKEQNNYVNGRWKHWNLILKVSYFFFFFTFFPSNQHKIYFIFDYKEYAQSTTWLTTFCESFLFFTFLWMFWRLKKDISGVTRKSICFSFVLLTPSLIVVTMVALLLPTNFLLVLSSK